MTTHEPPSPEKLKAVVVISLLFAVLFLVYAVHEFLQGKYASSLLQLALAFSGLSMAASPAAIFSKVVWRQPASLATREKPLKRYLDGLTLILFIGAVLTWAIGKL